MVPNVMFVGAIIYFNLMSWGFSIQRERSEFRDFIVGGNTEERLYYSVETPNEPNLPESYGNNYNTSHRIRRSPRHEPKTFMVKDGKKYPIHRAAAPFRRSSAKDGDFAKQFLKAHNEFRYLHGVDPLTLDPTLTEFAQFWADNLTERGAFEHSKNGKYGENLFMMSGPSDFIKVTGEMPVKAWYSEIDKYNFEESKYIKGTGHFTQVIWKDTKKLGVGVGRDKMTTIVVGSYYPPGNYLHAFKENVLPLKGKSRRSRQRSLWSVPASAPIVP